MLKKMRSVFVLLFIFSFSATLMGNEWANYYFPDALDSYWTYEDQDGEELTRYAIAPEKMMAKPIAPSVMNPSWRTGRTISIIFILISTKSVTTGWRSLSVMISKMRHGRSQRSTGTRLW